MIQSDLNYHICILYTYCRKYKQLDLEFLLDHLKTGVEFEY